MLLGNAALPCGLLVVVGAALLVGEVVLVLPVSP